MKLYTVTEPVIAFPYWNQPVIAIDSLHLGCVRTLFPNSVFDQLIGALPAEPTDRTNAEDCWPWLVLIPKDQTMFTCID